MLALLSLFAAFAGPFDAVDQAGSTSEKASALLELTEGETGAEAYSRLGALLADEGQPALAVLAYTRAFELNPDAEGADKALTLASEIGDVGPLALALADRASAPGDGDAASAHAMHVARELLRDDQLTKAGTWLARVDADSPAFADGESLRGVVLAARGKHTEALVPLQTARALGKTLEKGERFDAKLLMNIARAHYAGKNYGQAIYHYSLVPRSSEYWADARFEKAWAHFRAEDVPGAIGELQTHQSPFFDELWFPEAWMLRAQSLFVMCRYASAVEAMDAYEARYQPILDDLAKSLEGMGPIDAYDDVVAYLDGGSPKLPEAVVRTYRSEDRIASVQQAVKAYEASDASGFGDVAETLDGWADARVTALKEREGQRFLARANRQREELGGMIAGLEIARIDILDRESRMYERAAATGQLERPDRSAELKKIQREKRGYRVWPFQGEYWVDELGWYQVSALSACPEQ